MSSPVIKKQDPQPVRIKNQPRRCAPMRCFEQAKYMSGNMARGSCIASTTWLRVRTVSYTHLDVYKRQKLHHP